MRRFGLVGYPLGHSFSKKYFTEKFRELALSDHSYDLFELEKIDHFPEIWNDKDLEGVNVTVPHKEAVKVYLDDFDSSAEKVGAVNVVKRTGDRLIGYNSDYSGFRESLESFLQGDAPQKSLILGTGGSSKAIKAVLSDLGIEPLFVSRSPAHGQKSYDQLDKQILKEHQLIVNTTPLGMHPKVDTCPSIPYEFLDSQHYLVDLVYNPDQTMFMKNGQLHGARTKNGLEMLHLQADKSWEIWNS